MNKKNETEKISLNNTKQTETSPETELKTEVEKPDAEIKTEVDTNVEIDEAKILEALKETETKKKRGRPKKEKQEEQEPEIIYFDKILGKLLLSLYTEKILKSKKEIEQNEVEAFSSSVDKLLKKYAPAISDKSELFNFALVMLSITLNHIDKKTEIEK